MGQMAVFSGPERRRRWSDQERLEILTEAFSPGACVARVAQQHDVSTSLVYTWRRKLREAGVGSAPVGLPDPGFAEATVVEGTGLALSGTCPAIVIELARGKRISIFAAASPALIAAALKALR